MMNTFYISVSVVFPLFCMMMLGYILRVTKILDEVAVQKLNKISFKVFLPFLLFYNIYNSHFDLVTGSKIIIFAVICVVAMFFGLILIVPLFIKEKKDCGVVIQGMFRSNFIVFALPIVTSLFGPENTDTAVLLVAFIIPLFNLLSIIVLQLFSGKEQDKGYVIREVIRNPLIIASVLGFIFVLTPLSIPGLIQEAVADVAGIATPLALITLGGSFKFGGLKSNLKLLIIGVVGKLIIMPGLFIPLGILAGFRGVELCALLAMFSSPTAVSTYTMAQNAGANDELAGQIVVIDSLLSVVTICMWIIVFQNMIFVY